MNCDKKTYQTIIVGLDMVPRYVGDYTMDQIYDFVKYAKGVNPTTTATISEFGNIAVVVHKLFGGEYDMWGRYMRDGNYEKAAEMARVIANLPEKKEVIEHD